jgi:hypothetical protein
MKKKIMIFGTASAILIMIAGILVFSADKYTGRPDFCGLRCHTMKNPYETWKKDKHKTGSHSTIKRDVTCVDCHYAPGEKPTPRAKFRALGQLFSYLSTKDNEVRKRAVVKDAACLVSDCHPKDKLLTKKIDYAAKYKIDYKGVLLHFDHETHEKKTIEGQKLHCSSCHIHNSAGKHFEVPKELCFLCHFRKAKENEGRAKCSVCHEISKAPLKKKSAGEEGAEKETKPITHQGIEKSKVSCKSCHFELIKGSMDVKTDCCVDCHHDPTPELMKKIEDKKLMHQEHVTKQTARCFNCHQPLEHKESSYLDAAIRNCATCHPEPHMYQKLIIAGEGGRGVDKFPIAHHPMRTNCLACHTKDGHDEKGRRVKTADVKTCGACHADKDKEKISKKWKGDVAEELKTARDVEKEAVAAIEEAKGKLPETAIKKAIAMLKNGQENLRIVDAGGGVHNKKYAMLLIETAVTSFEDLIKELKKREGKE